MEPPLREDSYLIRNLTELVERARALGPAKIAVVEAHDPDVLESLKEAEPMGLAQATLVGTPEKIEAAAKKAGYSLRPELLVATAGEDASIRQAIDLVREGRAHLLMKGKVTTANLIRGVLDKERGLRTGRLLSQVIVFQVPHISRLMIMTDGAINIAPTLAQKADICRNAIEVAQAIGIAEPKVALLTALEFVNPDMPATVDAAALVQMNRRGQITGAHLEGPLALDVPLSRFAADRKNIRSPLVEATDVFICPDIEAANILYRAILYFARGESGGIVVGARVPLVLLSRAETPETKIRSIALALLVMHHRQGGGEAKRAAA
jgi:phosphate butyryltransferase